MSQYISDITSLSSKGQVVLPISIRKGMNIQAGAKLIVISDGENILLEPIVEPDITEVHSMMDSEYKETFEELRSRYPDKPVRIPLTQIAASCKVVTPTQNFRVCRDPDDDKFFDSAVEGKCVYIVSGDKDLLSLEHFHDVEIVTVAEFFSRYMPSPE